jgi:electron transfer flavoprotein alpha subunit
MGVLVWAEHDNAALKDATLSAVSAAAKLGEVHVLVAGSGVGGVAEAASKIAGVAKVLVADDAAYAHGLAENVAPLVVGLMGGYDAFVAPATTTGKNIAPRVAALLDVAQISDILSVEGPKTFTRPIYAGNAIATVESSDAKLVITARGTAFAKAEATGGSADRNRRHHRRCWPLQLRRRGMAKSERPELTSAKVIVSGGRAKDAETLPPPSSRWPTSWARRWAHRARRSMPAMCPTIIRWARPARSSRRSLYRGRHQRRDPASGGHEGQQDHHRHQQGRTRRSFRWPTSGWWRTCSTPCLN